MASDLLIFRSSYNKKGELQQLNTTIEKRREDGTEYQLKKIISWSQ
jgi:hypothetical protein